MASDAAKLSGAAVQNAAESDFLALGRGGLRGCKHVREGVLQRVEIRTVVRLAPNVLALPNRHPAVIAKMAETLDRLSGGRLILALGGGAPINSAAFRAFGLPQRSASGTVAATEEAIDVIRGLWNEPAFSYAGDHFTTTAADLQPRPARPIPLWLGAFGPRMLELVGRKADGWLPSLALLEPERAYQGIERIRHAAHQAGRDPQQLTFGYNVAVLVKEGASSTPTLVAGPPEVVARRLAAFVRGGFTFLNLWPSADTHEQRERLAREVIPILRAETGHAFVQAARKSAEPLA